MSRLSLSSYVVFVMLCGSSTTTAEKSPLCCWHWVSAALFPQVQPIFSWLKAAVKLKGWGLQESQPGHCKWFVDVLGPWEWRRRKMWQQKEQKESESRQIPMLVFPSLQLPGSLLSLRFRWTQETFCIFIITEPFSNAHVALFPCSNYLLFTSSH